MKAELRERLGKVLYEEMEKQGEHKHIPWDRVTEYSRETYRRVAEAVGLELLGLLIHAVEGFKSVIIEGVEAKKETEQRSEPPAQ